MLFSLCVRVPTGTRPKLDSNPQDVTPGIHNTLVDDTSKVNLPRFDGVTSATFSRIPKCGPCLSSRCLGGPAGPRFPSVEPRRHDNHLSPTGVNRVRETRIPSLVLQAWKARSGANQGNRPILSVGPDQQLNNISPHLNQASVPVGTARHRGKRERSRLIDGRWQMLTGYDLPKKHHYVARVVVSLPTPAASSRSRK